MQVCSLRDVAEKLEQLGVSVYAMSLDDVAAQKAFAEAQELNFGLLSDTDGSAARKYGVLGKRGYAQRVTFLIDDKGVLRHIDREVKVRSHGADLVALVERIK